MSLAADIVEKHGELCGCPMVKFRRFDPYKVQRADRPSKIPKAPKAERTLGALATLGNTARSVSTATMVGKLWDDDEEERAGVIEFDGNLPRNWSEAFARLNGVYVPAGTSSTRWDQFLNDCGMFLDAGWAIRAHRLGWSPLDLFGCDRRHTFIEVTTSGLLWQIAGGKLRLLAKQYRGPRRIEWWNKKARQASGAVRTGAGVARCPTACRVGTPTEFGNNPMNQEESFVEGSDVTRRLTNMRAAARCGARNRAGNECQCPAIRDRKRCRLHGGKSPGAPHGPRNGNFKEGDWTKEAEEERRWLRSLLKSMREKGR